jgi:hypothetical protein
MYELSDRIERLRKKYYGVGRWKEPWTSARGRLSLAPRLPLSTSVLASRPKANLHSQRPKEQKVLETSNDPNPFQNYPSIASILAFVAKSDGLAAVPLVLREVNLDAETLAEVAYELESVGLLKVAGVVEAAMADAPSELDRCPHEAGSLNARCWLESLQSRRLIRRQSVMT